MNKKELEKRIQWLDEQLVMKRAVVDNELFQLEAILKELILLREKLNEFFS